MKSFTIDCGLYTRNSGTRYRVTYGIASNHINGLNTDPNYLNYWPDTLEVDGLNVTNWSESLGFELHTLMPLYMMGKAATQTQTGKWTVRNLRYDGEPFTSATYYGTNELMGPGTAVAGIDGVRSRSQLFQDLTAEQSQLLEDELAKSDIVVEYKGDEPRVLLRMKGVADSNDCWISAFPYFVEHRGNTEVAYFSGREFIYRRDKTRVNYPNAGIFFCLGVYGERIEGKNSETIDGTTEVQHVWLARTHVICQHQWGSPTYSWAVDGSECLAKRVCAPDPDHVEEEEAEISAEVTRAATCVSKGQTTYTARFSRSEFSTQTKVLEDVPVDSEAHDWGEWVVTREPAEGVEGEETRVCKRDPSHVERRSYTAKGPESPETLDTPDSPDTPASTDTPAAADMPAPADMPATSDTPATAATPATPVVPVPEDDATLGWTYTSDGAWRYLAAEGATKTWVRGWLWDGSGWYLFDNYGAMRSVWAWDSGWYHLHEQHDGFFGAMDTGWVWDAGEWYFLNPDADKGFRGVMRVGWSWDGSAWYYHLPSARWPETSRSPAATWAPTAAGCREAPTPPCGSQKQSSLAGARSSVARRIRTRPKPVTHYCSPVTLFLPKSPKFIQ